jgi:hypothetical protein
MTETLTVGPAGAFRLPSQAVAAAHPGDTVRIAPGRYVDCTIIAQDHLTLEGEGPEVVLADRSCAGKGILVITGHDVTVRNLSLRGARVPDRNGAGIRAEGGDLQIDSVRFVDNENGVLTAPGITASIRITGSDFVGNGGCAPDCAHGVYAGAIGLLRIERSRFAATRMGHHIKSRAARTEILDCDIAEGADGTASYLVDIPNGGAVLIEGNRMQKGRHSDNPGAAIMIGAEGVRHATPSPVIRANLFANDQARSTVFVVNRSEAPALLEGNVLTGLVRPLAGPGTVR